MLYDNCWRKASGAGKSWEACDKTTCCDARGTNYRRIRWWSRYSPICRKTPVAWPGRPISLCSNQQPGDDKFVGSSRLRRDPGMTPITLTRSVTRDMTDLPG